MDLLVYPLDTVVYKFCFTIMEEKICDFLLCFNPSCWEDLWFI